MFVGGLNRAIRKDNWVYGTENRTSADVFAKTGGIERTRRCTELVGRMQKSLQAIGRATGWRPKWNPDAPRLSSP